MSAITMETSYVNSDGDMGQAHIDAHAKQHDYLLPGEKKVIVLSNTQLEDKSQDLALQKAITQGVKTEEEWKEYNSKLMPSRRKKSYQEYIKSLSNNYTKNIQRQLDKGTLSTAKKDKNYQSLKAIERNGGLAIEGDLYYLGNVDDYENKNDKELKKYREFQAETFKRFYYSDIFKILNKGCFRCEIHQDERGATHLQTQKTNYHMNSRGRVEMAAGACQREALIELYGSEEELNKRLDLLQKAHDVNDKNKKKGVFRTDAVYWANQKVIGGVKPATAGKRRMRIPELYRMEQMHELGHIARETAKQYNIDYKVDRKYTTDGVHKTAAGYAAERKSQKKADKIIEDANKKAQEVEHGRKKLEEEKKKMKQKEESLLERKKRIKEKEEQQAKIDEQQTKRENRLNNIWNNVQEQVNAVKNFVKRTAMRFGLDEKFQNNIANEWMEYPVPREKGGLTKETYTGSDWALTAIHENPKRFTSEVVKDLTTQNKNTQNKKKDDELEL